MSDSDILLKAAINRISVRLTEKLINSAQALTVIAEEMPEKLQNEWSSFKEEVIEEYERIEKKESSATAENSQEESTSKGQIQIQINNLRSKVININKVIEGKN